MGKLANAGETSPADAQLGMLGGFHGQAGSMLGDYTSQPGCTPLGISREPFGVH